MMTFCLIILIIIDRNNGLTMQKGVKYGSPSKVPSVGAILLRIRNQNKESPARKKWKKLRSAATVVAKVKQTQNHDTE